MNTTTFQIKKESNRAAKDALIEAGCRLVSASKKRYVIETSDISLIPNDARIQVSRAHWSARIANFAALNRAPEAHRDYNPMTGEFDGEILGFSKPGDITFISGKQFKAFA